MEPNKENPKKRFDAEAFEKAMRAYLSEKPYLHSDEYTDGDPFSLGFNSELARELGFRALLLCGDPDYYLYQGFVPAEMLGIRTADNMYAMALHVCELYDGALSGIRGRYVEDSIYDIDPSAAEAFDREFPAKGKVVGTESQRRFDEIVVVRRPAE